MEPRLREAAGQQPHRRRTFSPSPRPWKGSPGTPPPTPPAWSSPTGPLIEYLPLYKGTKGELVTQFDMKGVEKVGLVKFDFLGLRTLTVIDQAVRLDQAEPRQATSISTPSPWTTRESSTAPGRQHRRRLPAGKRRHAGPDGAA